MRPRKETDEQCLRRLEESAIPWDVALAAAARAYLREFGPEGYTLIDFVTAFVPTALTPRSGRLPPLHLSPAARDRSKKP
jgi:hypothetical protein